MTSGFLRNNSRIISQLQKAQDIAYIYLLLMLSSELYGINWTSARIQLLGFSAVGFFLVAASIVDLYRSWRGQKLWLEFQTVFLTLVIMGFALLLLGYMTKTSEQYSRLTLGTWAVLLPVTFTLSRLTVRLFLRRLRKKGYNTRKAAIVGSGQTALRLTNEIGRNSWMGIQIAGYYDEPALTQLNSDATQYFHLSGDFSALLERAKAGEFDHIYIALPMQVADEIEHLIAKLSDCSVPVHLMPDLFTASLLQARTNMLGTTPLLSVFDSPLDDLGIILKRFEDVILSILILAIVAIPMLIIAIAIKLTSKGPIIFKQRRYGLQGNEIEVWKFRSMTVTEDGDHVPQAQKDDPRITRLGAFLRKTSLDELPQFFNVLQGQMSIVGPRPHAVAHNEKYRKSIDGYMLRHLMKPGITGWAQVNGWRGETDTDDKMKKRVEYDLDYMHNWSLLMDLKIILMTVFKGFTNRNAY